MTRVRRRHVRERRAQLTFDERHHLQVGPNARHLQRHPAAEIRWTTEAERRAAWFAHRDEFAVRFGERPGQRPAAFWQYETVGVLGPDAEAGEDDWWERDLETIRHKVAYLAEHGLLVPGEADAIRHPRPRADGELHDWDSAARDGLARSNGTPMI